MIVADERSKACLLHWAGEKRLTTAPFLDVRKALEGNTQAADVLDNFGESVITAYVGFIDLAGFSTIVQGKSPGKIVAYLKPFLEKSIKILTGRHALVDKMIGDEVMFVLPEYIGLLPSTSILLLGQLLGGLHDLAFELQPEYKYRIGLSYGKVQLFHLVGEGYSEWTVVGEPVHVAKRLHGVKQLESPDPVCGAYGLSLCEFSIESAKTTLQKHLAIVAGIASRFSHELIEQPQDFKGVGKVLWAHLLPKVMPDQAKTKAEAAI